MTPRKVRRTFWRRGREFLSELELDFEVPVSVRRTL